MTSKKRLKQFIDFKGLDYYPFEMKSGLSNGALKKATGVSSTSLEKIHNAYPELNMDWVITGRGEMLLLKEQNIEESCSSLTHAELREMIEDKRKIIKELELKLQQLTKKNQLI